MSTFPVHALCPILLILLLATPSPADTKAAPGVVPRAIVITVEVVDVHPSVVDNLDKSIPDGPKKATLMLEALFKDQVNDAVIMSLQIPNDFPGAARYYKIIGFPSQDKISPDKNFVTLVTSMNVTPHLEGDNVISVKLKTLVTRVSPQGIPNTIGRALTLPRRSLRSGETVLVRGQPLDGKGKPARATDHEAVEEVTFITATVLPVNETEE